MDVGRQNVYRNQEAGIDILDFVPSLRQESLAILHENRRIVDLRWRWRSASKQALPGLTDACRAVLFHYQRIP